MVHTTVYILNVEGVVVMLLKECQWPTFFHLLSIHVCYMCVKEDFICVICMM